MKIFKITISISQAEEWAKNYSAENGVESSVKIIKDKLSKIVPNCVFNYPSSPLVDFLAKNGKEFSKYKVSKIRGFSSMGGCHQNLTRYLRRYPSSGLVPCTGYAPFNGYGGLTWISHSWGIIGATIVEFTPITRDIYWGCEIPVSLLQWEL